jgi:hypothetical protein
MLVECGSNVSLREKEGVGFGHYFRAMLAKQDWKLIIELDPLCARLIGAKYYPNGDILNLVSHSHGKAFSSQFKYPEEEDNDTEERCNSERGN